MKGGVTLVLDNSILKDIREAVGLTSTNSSFDVDLLIYINSAIGRLNQNGVGNFLVVDSDKQTWEDLKDPRQVKGNLYFKMVTMYVAISTKLLFDPPPPSSIEYHSNNANEQLWRLKIAYEIGGVSNEGT